jgi:uncharacterized protein
MTNPMTRRRFLSVAAGTVASGVIGAGVGYSLFEARTIVVNACTIPLENLPADFHGLRIALMTDFHCSYFITREHISAAVKRANELEPDLVLLAGDYVHNESDYIVPVMEELGKLRAPLGVYAVQGNRDIWVNRLLTTQALVQNNITETTNRGIWMSRGESRIWLCGIDDCNEGTPDMKAALNGASPDSFALALTHNPYYADFLDDRRIGLVLCGHTHGGQINFPLIGRPFLPSGCKKYSCGLIQGPHNKVFVSTGIGSIFPPVRFNCPPEIALLTLTTA